MMDGEVSKIISSYKTQEVVKNDDRLSLEGAWHVNDIL